MGDEGVYYADYLQLDRLLDCQQLESTRHGHTAHDEMLFIVVHQAYELWFKQILWELDAVCRAIGRDTVDEKEMGRVVAHLERIVEIQRLLLQQLSVLETMTPLDFLDFRDYLVPASGFQSLQFRLIENRLGLDPRRRMRISGAPYTTVLAPEHAAEVTAAEHEPSLLHHVDRWLARTPFLHFGDFDFWHAYRGAVERMLDRERKVIASNPHLDEDARADHLAQFEATATTFESLFDADRYQAQVDKGERRLSQSAFLAALQISLYRDEPIFHMPHRFLTALVDIDEGFTAWRQRHALMVHRMIGGKTGTGGTAGHRYLQAAAEKHKAFGDLFDLSTYHIPRSELPELPPEVREQMGFRWAPPR